jgi:hypothetical protein
MYSNLGFGGSSIAGFFGGSLANTDVLEKLVRKHVIAKMMEKEKRISQEDRLLIGGL